MSEELPVTFEEKPAEEVAIDKKKAKAAEQKAIAQLFQSFGGKVIRVKMKLLNNAGVDLNKYGLKNIGTGKVFFTGEKAEEGIEKLEADIEAFKKASPAVDPKVIVELRRAQIEYTRLMLETGQSYLEASKEAAPKNPPQVHVAFPAGQAIMVATGKVTESTVGNGTEKHLTNGDGGT